MFDQIYIAGNEIQLKLRFSLFYKINRIKEVDLGPKNIA